MSRVPFGEVKRDIKTGYNYMEYEANISGGDITVILDGHNECIIVDCSRWHESKGLELNGTEDFRIMRFSIDEFMAMSYKELTKRVNYCLFY